MEKRPTVRQWLYSNISRFSSDEFLIRECCKECLVTKKTVQKRLSEIRVSSRYQLLEIRDVRKRIHIAIDFLKDNVISDYNLRNELRIGNKDWHKLKNLQEFCDCHMVIKGKLVWGKPHTLQILRNGIEEFYLGD